MSPITLEQWKKIGKGTLLAGLAAGLVYLLQGVDAFDFGEYDVMVASGIAVLLNIVRKLFSTE